MERNRISSWGWKKHRRINRQKTARRFIWSPDYLHTRPLFAALQKHIRQFNGLVLDIGCGNQPYLNWFDHNSTQIIGFDPDLSDSNPNVVGIGQYLPFQDCSFDGILSTQTLEHTAEPWIMMADISRVLKPGGRLVLTAPQAWRVHEAPHDYYRFTKYGLSYLAERNGLIVESVTPLGGVWAVIGQNILNIIPHNRLFGLTTPINLIVNSIFMPLNAIYPDKKEAMDNILIARKPEIIP